MRTISPAVRRYLREAGIAGICATVPALALAVGIVKHGQGTFVEAFLHEGVLCYAWAFLTPAILWATRRFPVDRPPRLGSIGAHITFGITCGLLHGLLMTTTNAVLGPPSYQDIDTFSAQRAVRLWMACGVVFYGVIATIGFAIDYHAKLRDRERTAARLEALLVESRLGALRMQLQPHFLFNTLNTVAMLVRQGDAQTSVRVLARLSELIRQVLDEHAPQEVPLADELEFVTRYLDIERVRFGDRLHVRVEADDDARATPVPHLLLQPLVENAIRHGIARRAGAARIDVSAYRDDGALRVTVRDDGAGLPEAWSHDTACGIGLRNTRLRLHYLYGEAACLEVANAPDGGAYATVLLPVREPYADA